MPSFLKQLKKKSKCPVLEVKLPTASGYYYAPLVISSSGKRCGDGRIEIAKDMLHFEKIGTLAHEMGHERCHRRRCQCFKNRDWVLVEIHAELHALHLLLRHQNRGGIMARFKRLQDSWRFKEYKVAKNIIRKRRIYRRCQEFIGNPFCGENYE